MLKIFVKFSNYLSNIWANISGIKRVVYQLKIFGIRSLFVLFHLENTEQFHPKLNTAYAQCGVLLEKGRVISHAKLFQASLIFEVGQRAYPQSRALWGKIVFGVCLGQVRMASLILDIEVRRLPLEWISLKKQARVFAYVKF